MLNGNDTLLVFYKTFPSNDSYTRIGRISNVEGLVEALGTGSQRIDLSEVTNAARFRWRSRSAVDRSAPVDNRPEADIALPPR